MLNVSPYLARLPHPGEYARAWRKLLTLPDGALCKWDWTGPKTAQTLRRDFSQALQCRINARGGEDWRNELTQLEIDWQRDRRDLNACLQSRVRVYQFRTQLFRNRFAHLLATYEN